MKEIDDIVLKDFTSTEHPRFVIQTDHSNKNVVLCIRGTYSIGDAILDIVCDEVPFLMDLLIMEWSTVLIVF